MTNRSEIGKILVVAPNWIGDAVMSIPAMERLEEDFPSAEVTLLGLPHIVQLFREHPVIDRTLEYHHKGGKKGLLSTVREIRQNDFSMAVLFPNSFRSAMMVRLAGVPLRAGYSRDGRGFLLNIPVRFEHRIKRLHHIEYYLHLESVLSASFPHGERTEKTYPPDGPYPTTRSYKDKWLHLSDKELEEARDILSSHHITSDDLIIGIHPGASYGSSKRWHPWRFALTARALIQQFKGKVIVFGGDTEVGIAEEIGKKAGVPLVSMAGKTSIRELMALIAHCRLFITNDSGPMHIAAASGVPVVAIFGSTDPSITGPIGSGHVVIKKDIPCSPCFKRSCPANLECMDLVDVEDVLEGVRKILGKG